MATSEVFENAYQGLTEAQKRAVDTVEGPVLVIAGPGTGKTHILTLRIANILLKTQANPGNILVLTFTDSAARTVRRRLSSLVGESVAREVFIFTFHSFAEYILQAHQDAFPTLIGKRLMGDVENTLLWRSVLEDADIVHLRTPKSPHHYLRDISMLQKDLVRERVSLDAYRTWAKEEGERIEADDSLRYQRDGKTWSKGDLKPDGKKKLERLNKAYEAATLIELYEARKDERDVYDFGDVLRFVVDALQSDEGLRAELQETFQYVLADEHQDANSLQHALLDALAFDEHPNLFVVGDEKQAIFRFQGADATHFKEFVERYPRTEVVALTDSFRSYQHILDQAHALAEEHLPVDGGHPQLVATRKGEAAISLLEASDPLAERDQVAGLIEAAISEGVAPHEIAVITSRNATANLMSEHLSARGIPVLRAGDVTLSSRPLVRTILAMLRYASSPLDTPALREVLLAPWWDAPLAERATFLLRTRDRELGSALHATYPEVASHFKAFESDAVRLPPLEAFSKILYESGARGYLLSHTEHVAEDIALVRKLMMHIEDMVLRDHDATLASIVESLTKADEHGLAGVKTSVLQREGQVTVITAHKAKGMEFERVFIVGLTQNEWEKGGKAALIPSPISMARTLDDVLRQFYVSLTRAKNAIVLSYARETGDGKERAPSMLIPAGLPLIAPVSDPLPLLHNTQQASELVCTLTRSYLTDEGLSPSALKEYLESPACFFAKRVLRLREPETNAIAIGNAVHEGIAVFLSGKGEDAAYGALEQSLGKSLLPRNSAFDQLRADARNRLAAYVAHATLGTPIAIEKVYTHTYTIDDCPVLLKGKVDAVFDTGPGVCIVDFKTSSTIRAHDEEYRHQLAFYDLLLQANDLAPTDARIVQVSPDDVVEHAVPLSQETRTEFKTLLDEVIKELLHGNWRKGEPSAYDDVLKLLS